jgi:hypothetical protein
MRILESYLNEYKKTTKDEQKIISNKMLKYIIGSCLKKMLRRAFNWMSTSMIGTLTKYATASEWGLLPPFRPQVIKSDSKLSSFLKSTIEENPGKNNETFGDWVMTYKPPNCLEITPSSFDHFLTLASGSSGDSYEFNLNIASIFHILLLSSLYAYLCLMKQLKHSLGNADEKEIRKNGGRFCNAIRIFYLVSHSNVMKAYFTCVRLPFDHPKFENHSYFSSFMDKAIHSQLGWTELGEKSDSEDIGVDEGVSKDSDVRAVYRGSLMSFVDHYAALRLLERRSIRLPAEEMIKLSLIAVKSPKLYYFPWDDLVKVIEKTCEDFRSTSTSDSGPVESEDMINKITKHIAEIMARHTDTGNKDSTSELNNVILAFNTLLNLNKTNSKLERTQYPPFTACIHCESSLAAVIYHLHGIQVLSNSESNRDLLKLFPASPSLHSSSFTP